MNDEENKSKEIDNEENGNKKKGKSYHWGIRILISALLVVPCAAIGALIHNNFFGSLLWCVCDTLIWALKTRSEREEHERFVSERDQKEIEYWEEQERKYQEKQRLKKERKEAKKNEGSDIR